MARMIRALRSLLPALAVPALLPLAAQAERATIANDHVRQVQASSTAATEFEGRPMFEPRHLVDDRGWSAWGSRPDDRDGAWVRLEFTGVQYVDEVRFVAGHNRDHTFYKACGRPARIRFSAGDQSQVVDFKDLYEQSARFDPPLVGGALTLAVEAVHGASKHGGVCLSAVTLAGPANPRATVPGLTERIRAGVGELADDLRHPRGKAALLAIGAPAMPELVDALDPQNPALTARAAEVLGALGDPRAVRHLDPLARHHDPAIADAARWALGALGSAPHFDLVVQWYEQSFGPRRDRAFDALAKSGDARALDIVLAELVDGTQMRQRAAEANLGRFGADAVAALEPMLSSTVIRERAAALRALGSVDHVQARDLLLNGLLDARSEIRAAAVHGMARRGDGDAHDRIKARWDSRYVDERQAVAEALGYFAQPDDLEILELLTSDGSMSVRISAAESLGRLGRPALKTLRLLARQGPDGATARAAAEALLRLDGRTDVDIALGLLASRHREVRSLAGDAIAAEGTAGHRALVAAVAGEDDAVRGPAGTELRRVGVRVLPDLLVAAERAPEAALPELLSLMAEFGDPMATPFAAGVAEKATDLTVRSAAVKALASCGGPEAVPALLAALDDTAVEVRRTAAAAVGEMKLYRAAGKLVALLEDADAGVQRAAVRALGQIRQRTALATLVDRYEQTVADYHGADLRQDLVVAIGRIGGRDSLRVLVDATSDPDLKVRMAAVEALR